MSTVQHTHHRFTLVFRWQDIGLMAVLLIALNVFDMVSTFYATNVLGLMELNPIATGFPVWLSVLKVGICLIPMACAYALEKMKMKNCLFLPFLFSAILIEFYAFVVAFNLQNILVS